MNDNPTPRLEGKTASEYVQEQSRVALPAGILVGGGKHTENLLFEIENGIRKGEEDIHQVREAIQFDLELAEILYPRLNPDELRFFMEVHATVSRELEDKYFPDIPDPKEPTVEIALQALVDSREFLLQRALTSHKKHIEGHVSTK